MLAPCIWANHTEMLWLCVLLVVGAALLGVGWLVCLVLGGFVGRSVGCLPARCVLVCLLACLLGARMLGGLVGCSAVVRGDAGLRWLAVRRQCLWWGANSSTSRGHDKRRRSNSIFFISKFVVSVMVSFFLGGAMQRNLQTEYAS